MNIGLDIDDTLIPYSKFCDSIYLEGCKELEISCFPTPDITQYHTLTRYGVPQGTARQLEAWLALHYHKCDLSSDSIQFVRELIARRHKLCVITHRPKRLGEITQQQLKPILGTNPEIQVHHAKYNKSDIMFLCDVQLILDDSIRVWEDVSRYPELRMISPEVGHNWNSGAPKYKDFTQALQMIDAIAKQIDAAQ